MTRNSARRDSKTGSAAPRARSENATGNCVKEVQRLPVRIDLVDYDPDKNPLFVGLAVRPYVRVRETPTGPDAGNVLQPHGPQPPPEPVAPQTER
jgi:membrane fusion protein (multidrug efflux system)